MVNTLTDAAARGPVSEAITPTSEKSSGPTTVMARQFRSASIVLGIDVFGAIIDNSAAA